MELKTHACGSKLNVRFSYGKAHCGHVQLGTALKFGSVFSGQIRLGDFTFYEDDVISCTFLFLQKEAEGADRLAC